MHTYPIITVNGHSMTDPGGRWYLDPSQEMRPLPGRRLTSVVVPGRQGASWPSNDVSEPFTFGITLLVLGSGATIDSSVSSLEEALRDLEFLMTGAGGPVEVVYQTSPTRKNWGMARFMSSTTAERVDHRTARVTFLLEVPGGQWRGDQEEIESWTAPNGASTRVLSTLAGSTSPIRDAKILVRGPFNRLDLADPITGQLVTINRALTSAQWLRFDFDSSSATLLTAESWTASGTDVSGQVFATGPNSQFNWVTLVPQVSGSISNRVVSLYTYIAGGGSNPIRVRARKGY